MYAASAVATGVSIRELRKDETPQKLPTMAVMAALVFAGQMINYAIPGTGSSGHLCGGMMLTAVLGPFAGFLSMIVILAIQALFFADGGLLALGANIWNMSFYGCFAGYFLIYRPILRGGLFSGRGRRAAVRLRIILASVLGCVATLQLGAFSVVLETALSGVTELPFGAFVAVMQPIHLAIGLVEGLVTAAVLVFIYESRPELLMDVDPDAGAAGRRSAASTLVVLAVVVAVVGGGFSLLASGNPDGLEWSMFGNAESGYSANMGLDEARFGVESSAADTVAALQEKVSFLPDYAFANDAENPVGTTVSGLLGSALVAGAALLIAFAGGFFRKKAGAQKS
jgi:cobalt/nickel transport system permease protein